MLIAFKMAIGGTIMYMNINPQIPVSITPGINPHETILNYAGIEVHTIEGEYNAVAEKISQVYRHYQEELNDDD